MLPGLKRSERKYCSQQTNGWKKTPAEEVSTWTLKNEGDALKSTYVYTVYAYIYIVYAKKY